MVSSFFLNGYNMLFFLQKSGKGGAPIEDEKKNPHQGGLIGHLPVLLNNGK